MSIRDKDIQKYLLNGPISGGSLTDDFQNRPYERPPELSDPDDAIRFHIDNLTEKKPVNSVIKLLEIGIDLKTLTETVLTTAVMEGIHSLDVSLTIAPVIYDYIKTIGDKAEINYKTGLESNNEDEAIEQEDFEDTMIRKSFNDADTELRLEEDDMDATNIEDLENIDRTRELNPGFDELSPLLDPNYKPPQERGPMYPFPKGSDKNPIMAGNGLMSRGEA